MRKQRKADYAVSRFSIDGFAGRLLFARALPSRRPRHDCRRRCPMQFQASSADHARCAQNAPSGFIILEARRSIELRDAATLGIDAAPDERRETAFDDEMTPQSLPTGLPPMPMLMAPIGEITVAMPRRDALSSLLAYHASFSPLYCIQGRHFYPDARGKPLQSDGFSAATSSASSMRR